MPNRRQKRRRELESVEQTGFASITTIDRGGGQHYSESDAYRELASSKNMARKFSGASLQRHAQVNFTAEEQKQLSVVLKQYKSSRHNTEELVSNLSVLLNTPVKRQAILSIRNQIPTHQLALFDKLVIVQRLWPPHAASSRGGSSVASPVGSPRRHQQARSPTSPFSMVPRSRPRSVTGSFRQEKIKPVKIVIKPDDEGSLGFDIRGGSEHGIGIFVCSVEERSEAFEKGIRIGHVIRKANGISFERVTREQAIEVLTDGSVSKIRLTILPFGDSVSNGVSPSGGQPVLYYTWTNGHGRSASPPPEYAAGIDLLHPNAALPRVNLKKVNIAKEYGQSLGLSIRGGLEHGLGIYISMVERRSVAQGYGLAVGDQIVSVNSVSFLNIPHTEAAEMLRDNEMLIMSLRSLGKLPERPIIPFDKIQGHTKRDPVYTSKEKPDSTRKEPEQTAVAAQRRGLFLGSASPQGKESNGAKHPFRKKDSAVFKPGFGTQLMFKGFQHAVHQSARASINQQARADLVSDEMETLAYYLDQYENKTLTVRQLVNALITLLDTPNKKRLLNPIRSIVKPKDIDAYEKLVAPVEYQAMKDSRLVGDPDEDDDSRVVDNFTFGISTFGVPEPGSGPPDALEVRQDAEGEAPKSDGDSDSIQCNPSLSHHNSRVKIQLSESQQLVMEEDLQARLGSLAAMDSDFALGSKRSLNRGARSGQGSSENGLEEEVEFIIETEPEFTATGSDTSLASTTAGEYDVQNGAGNRRPSDIGIAFASSSIEMVQLQPQNVKITVPPTVPSTRTPKAQPVVAQHRSVLALKPPATEQPAESPFVERRDSPRKIVQVGAASVQDRGGTLDGAALSIPLLTSTPLQNEGTTGMFSDGDPDSRPASAHGEDDLLAAIVRKRRLRIQPESTANFHSLNISELDEVSGMIEEAGNDTDAVSSATRETTVLHSEVLSTGEPPMSASNSFDMPDNVQLQTRYVYNDTSEMGTMPEIQYTDTDF